MQANASAKQALLAELVNRVTERPEDMMIHLLRFFRRDRPFEEEAVCDLLNCAYQDCEDYPEQYSDAVYFAGNSVMARGFAKARLDRRYTFPDFPEDLRSEALEFAERAPYGAETEMMVPIVKEVAIHYFSWCRAVIEGFLSDEDSTAMAHLLRRRGAIPSPFKAGRPGDIPLCLLLPVDGQAPCFSLDPTGA